MTLPFLFSNNDPLLQKHFKNAVEKSKNLIINEKHIHFKIDAFQADFDWDWNVFNDNQKLCEDDIFSEEFSYAKISNDVLSKVSHDIRQAVTKSVRLKTHVSIGIEVLKEFVTTSFDSFLNTPNQEMKLKFLSHLQTAVATLTTSNVSGKFDPTLLLFDLSKVSKVLLPQKLGNSQAEIAAKTLYWSCQNHDVQLVPFDKSHKDNAKPLIKVHTLKCFLERRNTFLTSMLNDRDELFESAEFQFLVRSYCCFLAGLYISNDDGSVFTLVTEYRSKQSQRNFDRLCKDSFWTKPGQEDAEFAEVRNLCVELSQHFQRLNSSITNAEMSSEYLLDVFHEIETFLLAEPAFALLAMGILEIKTASPEKRRTQKLALVCVNAGALELYFSHKATGRFPFDAFLDIHNAQNSRGAVLPGLHDTQPSPIEM